MLKMNIEDMLEAAVFDGVITGSCKKCGASVRMEPDADRAYCQSCDSVQPMKGLASMGLI